MIEMMAALGVLGEYKGSQAREVMMAVEDWDELREQLEQEKSQKSAATTGDSETTYVNEGQKGYAAVDKEEQ